MKLSGKRAALLVEEIYNDFEVWIPYYRLLEEGARVTVVGSGTASTYHSKYGIPIDVDKNASEVAASELTPLLFQVDTLRIRCVYMRRWSLL